jgi:hypothetical protein
MFGIVEQYNKVKAQFNGPQHIITQGQLRAEVPLTSGKAFEWNLQATNSEGTQPPATSKLLKNNDAFVATDICIAIKQIAADSPTAAQHAAAILYYYNNPAVFAGANAANVGVIYNGYFQWSIDSTIYSQTMPISRFQRVPTSQQGTTSAAIAGPVEYTIARDGIDSALYGFYPLYPYFGFNGTQTMVPSMVLPTTTNFDDASNSVWAVLMLNGWYISQGADMEFTGNVY